MLVIPLDFPQSDDEFLRNLTSRLALFLVHGSSFEPQRWMPEIAPRPLVIVAARDDDYVPREAQKPLEDAASSPYIELIWTNGRHIGPNRGDELQQLIAIVRNRAIDRLRESCAQILVDWSEN